MKFPLGQEAWNLECVIEGILFAAGDSVPLDRLAEILEREREEVEQAVSRLTDYYAFERRGMRVVRMKDNVQLVSAPEYAAPIRAAVEMRKAPSLSQPALEVLAIVAYYQPTTRAFIDQVRGVDSAYTVGLLQERELIEECGRLDVPGRPVLFQTTENFLRAFRLQSLEELPDLEDLAEALKQQELEEHKTAEASEASDEPKT